MWTPHISESAELTQWSLYINHYSKGSSHWAGWGVYKAVREAVSPPCCTIGRGAAAALSQTGGISPHKNKCVGGCICVWIFFILWPKIIEIRYCTVLCSVAQEWRSTLFAKRSDWDVMCGGYGQGHWIHSWKNQKSAVNLSSTVSPKGYR